MNGIEATVHANWLLQAVVVMFGLVIIWLWHETWACRCPDCVKHTRERADRERRQAELRHNAAHKGYGWRDSDPDRFRCPDDGCPRNPSQPPGS